MHSRMCGNSCARTGSAIKYGPATRPSSMPAATRGTSSCKCPNESLPSPSAGGHYKRSANRAIGIISPYDATRTAQLLAVGIDTISCYTLWAVVPHSDTRQRQATPASRSRCFISIAAAGLAGMITRYIDADLRRPGVTGLTGIPPARQLRPLALEIITVCPGTDDGHVDPPLGWAELKR